MSKSILQGGLATLLLELASSNLNLPNWEIPANRVQLGKTGRGNHAKKDEGFPPNQLQTSSSR